VIAVLMLVLLSCDLEVKLARLNRTRGDVQGFVGASRTQIMGLSV